jgi:hypothetical protein
MPMVWCYPFWSVLLIVARTPSSLFQVEDVQRDQLGAAEDVSEAVQENCASRAPKFGIGDTKPKSSSISERIQVAIIVEPVW